MHPARSATSYPQRTTDAASSDDAALVRRIADGDETALAAFYDQWAHPVYSLAVHLLRDVDEAEDVAEEAFWQVWQRAGAYDPARGTVRTWVLTIARSRALDRLRARRRRPESDQLDTATIVSTAPGPSLDAEARERQALVAAALESLPTEQRQALELAYFGGLTQTEIAERLGEPLGTIKTRTRLALRKLRDKLTGLQEPGDGR